MPDLLTFDPTRDEYLDGLLAGLKWAVSDLTFSFPASGSFYGPGYGSDEPATDFAPLNQAQMAAARSALGLFSAVARLGFREIVESSTEHADVRYAGSGAPSTAWAYFPHPAPEGGDVWINSTSGWYTSPIKGTYAYQTFLHEAGHSLGLKHSHEVEGGFGAMPLDHDSLEYTVMSYRSHVGASTTTGYTAGRYDYPQTLMMEDIRAAQHLYGANFDTNSGDTTYRWSAATGEFFIDGIGQGAPAGNRILMTVWDGQGVDTYDFSGYLTDLRVDLRPGAWSTLSVAQLARLDYYDTNTQRAAGNVANAYQFEGDLRSLIENAVGGAGHDTIAGNQVANVLAGNAGNDVLHGLEGDDTLSGGTASGGTNQLWGGEGADTASYAWTSERTYADLRTGRAYLGGVLTDQLMSIENIAGGLGQDTLVGDGGCNKLDGGGGTDLLYGLAGDDWFVGATSAAGTRNQLWGGEGSDTVDYSAQKAAVYVELRSLAGYVGGALRDLMNSIENVVGGAGRDILAGDATANRLTGGCGADILHGRGGADVFVYGTATDSAILSGYDTIADFERGVDRLDLSAFRISADDVTIRSGAASTSLYADLDPCVGGSELAISLVGANAISLADIIF